MKRLGYLQVRPCIRPTCYPAVSGGESVIRLSLGKLLVNLLHVVKRTKTFRIPQQQQCGAVSFGMARHSMAGNGCGMIWYGRELVQYLYRTFIYYIDHRHTNKSQKCKGCQQIPKIQGRLRDAGRHTPIDRQIVVQACSCQNKDSVLQRISSIYNNIVYTSCIVY